MKKLLSVVLLTAIIITSSVSAFASSGYQENLSDRYVSGSQMSSSRLNEYNKMDRPESYQGFSVQVPTRVESRSDSRLLVNKSGVVYEKTFVVTPKGGTFKVGFVTLNFPKNFLPSSELPRKFTAKVFASDGHGVIELTPDTDGFLQPVKITVNEFSGILYDEIVNRNTFVKYQKESFFVNHFSRYCWQ